MRYSRIRSTDISNGPGFRVSIFVQGCTRHCDKCFNPETWDFNGGSPFTDVTMNRLISFGDSREIIGYSILGGEPLQQGKDMLNLVKTIKEKQPEKTIWMWTGFTFEELNEEQKEIIKYIDVLVDGPFIEKCQCPNVRFKGSTNQRVIDIKATLEQETIVLYDTLK